MLVETVAEKRSVALMVNKQSVKKVLVQHYVQLFPPVRWDGRHFDKSLKKTQQLVKTEGNEKLNDAIFFRFMTPI